MSAPIYLSARKGRFCLGLCAGVCASVFTEPKLYFLNIRTSYAPKVCAKKCMCRAYAYRHPHNRLLLDIRLTFGYAPGMRRVISGSPP